MPVFKNEDNGTWYVMARYVNWKGERKQKCKRGFATKREAQEYLVNSCIVQAEQCSSDFEIFVCSQIFVKRGHLNQSTDMLQIIPLPRVAVKLDASRCGAQNAGEHF